MNVPSVVSESSRDVMAAAIAASIAGGEESVSDAWFATPSASEPPRRMSSHPPVVLGDFVGDPEVDGWLR